MRIVITNPEILEHAVNDALNMFVREVLVPRGVGDALIDDPEVVSIRKKIIKHVTSDWRSCEINDDV